MKLMTHNILLQSETHEKYLISGNVSTDIKVGPFVMVVSLGRATFEMKQ